MTTCRRFYRECPEFNICVNIGKKDYVLAEDPEERYTIFQYGIEGIGKFGRIFESDYITFEGGKFYLFLFGHSALYTWDEKCTVINKNQSIKIK